MAIEGYKPTSGMQSAARRAIKLKEDGKANGAGTMVGWTRAGQLARGETLSLSTVKRMYSFFARHEVDKKGKDFDNVENPSNGKIMWLAWGGDAGFSWSKKIAEREKNTKKMIEENNLLKAKSISVGDHVQFDVPKPPDKTEYAHGIVERIETSGKIKLSGTNETVEASSNNPVAVVRVYASTSTSGESGKRTKTDRRVVKPFSALTVEKEPISTEKVYESIDLEKASTGRLKELVDKYNEGKEGNKRISIGTLQAVYRRGIGAYGSNPSSVRPNVGSAEQWAMGRVNAFMAGLRGRFPRKSFDLDLFPKGHPRYANKEKGKDSVKKNMIVDQLELIEEIKSMLEDAVNPMSIEIEDYYEVDLEKYDNSITETGETMENVKIEKKYENCGCETCKAKGVACKDCPKCSEDMAMGKYYQSDDENMDKWDNIQKACWDGYEQQGMKDKDGRKVPNCVYVGKSAHKSKEEIKRSIFGTTGPESLIPRSKN